MVQNRPLRPDPGMPIWHPPDARNGQIWHMRKSVKIDPKWSKWAFLTFLSKMIIFELTRKLSSRTALEHVSLKTWNLKNNKKHQKSHFWHFWSFYDPLVTPPKPPIFGIFDKNDHFLKNMQIFFGLCPRACFPQNMKSQKWPKMTKITVFDMSQKCQNMSK